MTESTVSTSTFTLLQLPQDVQLSVLLSFNVRELIICKQLCHSLADLIEGDISIQYKMELARSGQIDGIPSNTIPVVNRFTSLRERHARFHAGDHPLARLRGQPFGSRSAFSSNGVVTTVLEGVIHFWRPSAAFSGIGELKITHGVRDLGLEGFNTGSCVADIAQDLLLLSRKDPDSRLLDCFIYSLSNGRPHPDAARSHISSSFVAENWPDYRSWDGIQVLGDLIAWNVPDPDERECKMRVINWMTGVTVWEFRGELWSRCRLISQSHAVVVTFDSLHIYPIDRHCQSPVAPPTSDTALCILQLPAWSGVASSSRLQVKSYIQFPPPLRRDDRPLYRHDPALTLLTLEVYYVVDTLERGPEVVRYAMFIPLSTLNARIEAAARVPPPRAPFPRGPPHVVPWAEWGPAGTRIVPLPSQRPWSFSPLGCSCAIAQSRGREPSSGALALTVFVFDVHPWATPEQQAAGERRRFVRLTEEDTRAGPALTEAMQTTFPFDVTRREIVYRPDDRAPKVVLVEDGLVLVTSPGTS